MIGYSRSELEKGEIRWDKITPSEFEGASISAVEQLETTGVCAPFEKQYIRKDGSRVWVLLGSSALNGNSEAQAVTYVINISNRKESDEKAILLQTIIEKQQKEFKSVFMNAPAFITIRRGPELRYDFVNRAVTEFSKRDDHVGKTPEEMYPGVINTEDQKITTEVYQTGESKKGIRHKLSFKHDDGNVRDIYLDYYITPVYDINGEIDGVAVFGFEVTDLVLANKEMEISKNRLEFIADTMPHKIWMADEKGNVQYMNKAWLKYADLSKDDISFCDWEQVLHPEERAHYFNILENALQNGTEFSVEHRLMNAQGEYRWHLSKTIPLKDNSGELVMWIGTNTDIHEQKEEVEQLKDRETYFRLLTDETPFMVWKSDVEGKCVYVNKKWVEFTGLSVGNSLGFGFFSAMLVDNPDESKQKWLKIIHDQAPYRNKLILKTADDRKRWVYAQANPFYLNSRFEGYVGSIMDITDQEMATQAIKDLSEKKDEFLSIASHELKTPLTSIKASVQLIERSIDPQHKAQHFVMKALDHLLRLEILISDLLDVSKINAGKLVYHETEFDFNEMLTESVNSIQQTSLTHQLIIKHSQPVVFRGDRFRIEQVVYNLLSNAIKYSPGANQVEINMNISDENIVVSVQDFGIGIQSENLLKTSERYYRVDSTSMRFQGLGLGLFISAEILKRHRGKLWIESEPDKGSIFYFSLPLNSSNPEKKL